MAIIYSYPGNPDLLPSDMLVGTSTKTYLGKIKNETKNFSLDALSYFTSTSQYNTLNTVLDNGNNSLLDANIGRLGLYDANGLAYAVIKVFTSEFEFYSAHYPLTPIVTFNDSSLVFNNMSHTSTILTGTPTANRTYTLPDASGTIALTSNIPSAITLTTIGSTGPATLISNVLNIPNYTTPTPTLDEVLLSGNIVYSDIPIFYPDNGLCSTSYENGNAVFNYSSSGESISFGISGIRVQTITPSIFTEIGFNSPSSNNFISFPDNSGVVALLSDIPPAITLTTTGSSGPATLIGGALNVPDYSSGISPGIQHGTAAGTDTYTVTISGVAAYADGDAYLIRFTNGNTTSCTLNINGLGARPLYRNNDGPLIGGDVLANGEMLCVYNSTSNIFQCIGVAPNTLLAYVTNAEAVTITKGQAVYVSGGVGDRVKVKLAYNTSDLTSAQTIGIVSTTSIGPNQKGIIIVQGQLDNLSLFPTSTWADGDYIYLGATPGTITNVKPVAPNHLVYLGYVTTASNGSAGRMYVKVQNGYELQELHNVYINPATLANYDGIFYNSATSLWENKNITQVAPERRNANNSTNNNINYCGTANKGSAEASAVWTIERLTIGAGGSVTIGTATNVAWTNRESVIYT